MRTRSQPSRPRRVALRKESVDRNSAAKFWVSYNAMSLSVRRAWIEIPTTDSTLSLAFVALRKESVDRNLSYALALTDERAVALRKESVDRNRPPSAAISRTMASLSVRRAWIEIYFWACLIT